MIAKFLTALTEEDAYLRNHDAALAQNLGVLKSTIRCLCVLFAILAATCPLLGDTAYLSAYLAAFAICLLLLVPARHCHGKQVMVFVYGLYLMFVAYAIYASAILSPNTVCITMLGALFHFIVLYMDRSWRANLVVVISAAVYIAAITPFKNPTVLGDEVANIFIFALLGCTIGTFTRRAQLNSFDMQEKLRVADAQYRLVLTQCGSIMCTYDVAERAVHTTKEVADLFAMPETIADMPYAPVRGGLIAPESVDAYIHFFEEIADGGKSGTASFRAKTARGWRWLKASYTAVFSAAGRPAAAVVSFLDFTDRREQELAYEKWKQEVQAIARERAVLFERNLTRDLPEGQTGTLIDNYHGLSDRSFNDKAEFYAEKWVHPDDRLHFITFLNRERLLWAFHEGTTAAELNYREMQNGGGFRFMHLSVQLTPYPDSGDVRSYIVIRDVDDERREAIANRTAARQDYLTKLLSRAAFHEEVEALVTRRQVDETVAFLMIDIDNFKAVNDTFGHVVGDRVLLDSADAIRRAVPQDALVGRMGGDEFAVCMVCTKEDCRTAAEALCQSVRQDLGRGVTVGASVGASLCPRDAATAEELYHRADAALYRAKQSGRGLFVPYSAELERETYVVSATPIDAI